MISAVAITYNESQNIERYIKSLSFADEIIIVDSHSTDNTVSLAESLGAKVIQRTFENFSDQKNFALTLAKHDWVTFFDLDELINSGLADEIISTVKNEPKFQAYEVKRNFHFMGKRIKHSGFQTDKVARLFNKNYCHYNSNLVHETLVCEGSTGVLNQPLEHYGYQGFDHYNNKLTQYSDLQAKDLYQKNVRPNLYHFLFKPWYKFVQNYVFRLGFLDGKEGFILCYVNAFAVFKRYIKLWLMYRHLN